MRYQAYPKYGEIQSDWLGTLPGHWEFRRLRFAASEPLMYGANEAAVLEDPDLPRYIRITDVKADGSLHDDTFRSLEEDVAEPYLLQDGDILLARSGATVGKSFQYLSSWGRAAYAGYLIRFRVDKNIVFPRFANYYFQTECYWACIRSTLIQSTIENFSAEKYKDLTLPIPSEEEQQQIAAFLDWKTGQIDALIARKKELLEKLKEKRAAVITQAVTKGLDRTVPMRDSGNPWLGQVPKHWAVMQLRRRWEINDCKHKTVSFVDDGIPMASIKEVHDFEVNLSGANQTTEEEYFDMIEGGRKPEIGDILYSRNATVGDASIVTTTERFCMGQDVCLLRSSDSFPRFVAYLLRSNPLAEQAEAFMVGSTFKRINVGQIKEFWVSVPPFEEQSAIAEYLDLETEKIDLMINKVETVIDRLTEYRTALITAATTGKIDVRKVKIPAAKPPLAEGRK